MTTMNETLVKYLAGLLDADGSLSFSFPENKGGRSTCHLRMTLVVSESIDRNGRFIHSLPEQTGYGAVYETAPKTEKHSTRYEWRVTTKRDINMFLPRLIKHMVVKGKHWQWMYNKFRELEGTSLSQYEVDALKLDSRESRLCSGPVKPKNHPTWAWVAGFLDGDGCYSHRFDKKSGRTFMRVDVEIAHYDAIANQLLYKAFGGNLRSKEGRGIEKSHWSINLGPKSRSFALSFLSKMAQHSRLKKHKIESLIHAHRQRLSESNPAG